ncbi:MAG: META domain-containing protein [Proteobacteria bacterium]|nr:META domain-containing protein [Pseudomonadota bacterium]
MTNLVRNPLTLVTLLIAAMIFAACVGVPPAAPQPSTAGSGEQPEIPPVELTADVLANMTYQSEWTQSGTATLVDGQYSEQAAPGSATKTVVSLTEHIAIGTLDGEPAAAVVLVTDPGGSGTFYDLAVVTNPNGHPTNVASTHLGDRVKINSIDIVEDQIVIDMVKQGPDDPMCCPTQQVVQTYELQGDQLVETSSEIVSTVETSTGETEIATPDVGSEIITLFVGPEKVECIGEAPQECMLVKGNRDDEYTLFYDSIEGFEHEPGFEYELLVQVEEVENPPADASSFKYTLVDVVDKSAVDHGGPSSATLEGALWILQTYVDAGGETVSVLPETRISLELLEGQMGGNDGCNNYFGTYQIEGDRLTLTAGGSTMMACPPAIMDQAGAYQTNLTDVTTYEILGSQLLMANEAGDVALAFAVDQPTPLVDTTWQLLSYYTGNGIVSNQTTPLINAFFAADGSLSGLSGCNNYMSSYTAEENSMSIEPVATTRKMCQEPEGVMETEAGYTSVLETVVRYEIEGEQLTLYNAEDIRAATYNALPTAELKRPPIQFDAEAAADSGLLDNVWSWQRFSDPTGADISIGQPNQYQLLFQADGTANVVADCNSGFGQYAVDGSGLWIEIQGISMAMCAPDSLSDQYVAYLNAAATYLFDGDTLIINLMADSGNMYFSP